MQEEVGVTVRDTEMCPSVYLLLAIPVLQSTVRPQYTTLCYN